MFKTKKVRRLENLLKLWENDFNTEREQHHDLWNQHRKAKLDISKLSAKISELESEVLSLSTRNVNLSKAYDNVSESKREIVLENHETVAHLENDNRRLRELVRLLAKDV